MQTYLQLVLELVVGFAALFLYTKLMGKTHFSQLTPFDFISVLILGELIGNAVYDEKVTISHILFATSTWAVLIFMSLIITQKFKNMRKFMEGEPSIVVRKGKIQYEVMKRNKMDLNQLQSLVRQKGYLSIREIEYAILETNGSLSVFPRTELAPVNRNDLNLTREEEGLPVTLILDGELVQDNLEEAGVDINWLVEQLKNRNIMSFKTVLIAEWQPKIGLYVQQYR